MKVLYPVMRKSSEQQIMNSQVRMSKILLEQMPRNCHFLLDLQLFLSSKLWTSLADCVSWLLTPEHNPNKVDTFLYTIPTFCHCLLFLSLLNTMELLKVEVKVMYIKHIYCSFEDTCCVCVALCR